MKYSRLRYLAALCLFAVASSCQADPVPSPPAPVAPAGAQWKTAYYKRGFVGNYQAGWGDGVDSTLRMRVPIGLPGTQVRVTIASMRGDETVLSKLSFAPGKDDSGTIAGTPVALNFGGAAKLTLAPGQADAVSDAAEVAVKPGTWYLQESYASEKYSYAYSVDGFFNQAGDHHDAPTLTETKRGVWPGSAYRIEVLTTDKRPIVLCYGDSITHGYNSTPNAGKSYPEVLGRLAKLPTLNLGVNGDLFLYTGGVPSLVRSFNGVETVIVLMGINDIINGNIKVPADYAKLATNLIGGLKHDGKKVFLGTITPAGGFAKFDADPQKEVLRQGINAWIRKDSGADAVLDFDAALADPANPSRLKAEYQSDWLHPNDAGYQKMAEVAASQLVAKH